MWRYSCIMKSTRELEAPGRPVARDGGWDGCISTPRPHQNGPPCWVPVYLIISTRAGWHMIKFKIHALECTRTRHFHVKKILKFSGSPDPSPAGGVHPGGGGGASNSLAPALSSSSKIATCQHLPLDESPSIIVYTVTSQRAICLPCQGRCSWLGVLFASTTCHSMHCTMHACITECKYRMDQEQSHFQQQPTKPELPLD